MPKTLHYIGICEDLLQTAANLLSRYGGDSPLIDLSDSIAVLPGKNMIRELSNELAKNAHGIFPPTMLTPSSLLRFGMESGDEASEMEQLQVWLSVLNDANDCRELHLDQLKGENASLIRNVAADLVALRNELSRNAHTFASAANVLRDTSDGIRWQELAKLEAAFQAGLQDVQRSDPTTNILTAIHDVSAFREYKKMFLIATPDLPPAVVARLENVLAQTDIEIHIFIASPDPEEMENKDRLFDTWGQIIPDVWKNCALPIDDNYHALHSVKNPATAAALAAQLVREDGIFDTADTIIAIADPAVFPDFAKEFSNFKKDDQDEHLSIYDPAGISMKELRIVPVLKLLSALGKDTFPATVKLFLRNHDLAAYCVREAGFTSTDQMLAASDHYFLAKRPDMIHPGLPDPAKDYYQEAPEALKKLFHMLQEIHKLFSGSEGTGVEPIRERLGKIFFAESYPPVRGVAFSSEEKEVRKALAAMEKSSMFNELPGNELLELLILTLSRHTCYPEHAEDAMEICGFLDLPFRNARNIILCGVNDELIPEKAGQSPYLTETKRKLLGLPDNDTRYARDCFYLSYLLQNMSREGKKLHLIAWEFNLDLTPARYSPLLFNGSDEELLKRIKRLYRKQEKTSPVSIDHGENTITLQPDFSNAFIRTHTDGTQQLILSVTDFKNLLESPLRAFFVRDRHMDQIDYDRLDLDHADFGTACHNVLEKIQNTFDEEKDALYKSMETALHIHMKRSFGHPLPLLIEIQQEILKNRLYHAAKEIAEGSRSFECIETEWKLGGKEQNGIPYYGAIIRGTIDRIEVSRDRNTLRLIDFKTFNKKESPAEKHLHANQQRQYRFTDLQLPLYKLLLPLDQEFRKKYPELDLEKINIVCGYFCLPTAVTETGYLMWDNLDSVMDLAEEQTKKIIDMLKEMQDKNICYDDAVKNIGFDDFQSILLPDQKLALAGIKFEPFNPLSRQKS